MPDPIASETPPLDVAESDTLSPLDAVRGLIADAQSAATNEIALFKAGGTIVARSLRQFSVWATSALLFAFVGLLSLAIGAIIALATIMGPTAAMATVSGLLFLGAAICALRSRSLLRRIVATVDKLVP